MSEPPVTKYGATYAKADTLIQRFEKIEWIGFKFTRGGMGNNVTPMSLYDTQFKNCTLAVTESNYIITEDHGITHYIAKDKINFYSIKKTRED